MHGVHDEIGGAVHDAAHGAHGVQPLDPRQIPQPWDAAAHGGGAAQRHALFLRQAGQLPVIGGDQRLVGGDHVFAPLHGGGDVLIRRVQAAHDLHHRVDALVTKNVVEVVGGQALRQPRLGAAQQHTGDGDIAAALCQLQYAAAHYAEAQQTDVHRNTPCPFDVASFYPVQPLLSIWEKSRTGGVRLL